MAEIRPEEQSEKAESCRVNLWNEIQLKGRVCVMISFRPAVFVCGQSFDVAIFSNTMNMINAKISMALLHIEI